jgi:hypothetical protein
MCTNTNTSKGSVAYFVTVKLCQVLGSNSGAQKKRILGYDIMATGQ